jgi:putative transposase
MIAVDKSKQTGWASVEQVCNNIYLHRDAYYKLKRRNAQRQTVESKVVGLVKKERDIQSRVGTRKLHKELRGTFQIAGLKVGRDRLFDILRTRDMLVKRKKASCKTTNSYHHFYKYNNLIKDMDVTAPNQVWVSDITYIRTVTFFEKTK